MSLESQRHGLFLVVSRKRERSPSFEREQSPLLDPPTPPATEEKRRVGDEEVTDWGVQRREWGDNHISESVQSEPGKRSRNRLWWAHDNSLLLVHQDCNDSSNFNEEYSSNLPLAMSTADLSTEESYNICTRSGVLTLSQEDLEDIANAATPVTPSPIASGRAHAMEPDIAQQTPAITGLQLEDPEDEGSCNLPGHDKLRLSGEEKSVGSSP